MSSINVLKQLSVNSLNVEEAVELYGKAGVIKTAYEHFDVSAPKWLADAISALETEIASKHRDMLKARLQEVKSRKEALKSAEEKRADLDAEEARLTKALGL